MIVYMFNIIFPRTFNLIDCDSPFFEVIEIGMWFDVLENVSTFGLVQVVIFGSLIELISWPFSISTIQCVSFITSVDYIYL